MALFHRRSVRARDDLFLAGRSMSRWPVAISMYVALFNDAHSKTNMATSLFIDQVYSDIMGKEKMKVYKEEAL